MGELKKHQPPMTIDEQVENLKNIGLIVDDEEYAKKILNDISYFRLIKAYSLNLKSKNGCYNKQTAFKEIVDLYLFNSNFRQLIFPEIEKVEINVRCRLANFFAEQYGVLGYLQAENFSNENYHAQFLEDEIPKPHLCVILRKIMKAVICLSMHWLRFLVLEHCQSFIRICLIRIKRR